MDTASNPSLARRFSRRTLIVVTTLLVGAGAIAAVIFGSNALGARANAVPQDVIATPLPVETEPLVQQSSYTVHRQFTGQIEAASSTVISFELPGKLIALNVREGASVSKDTVIAQLDTALLEAETNRLTASRAGIADQLTFAESRLDRVTTLRSQGFASQELLDQAQATRDELRNRIMEMDAALEANAINIAKSVLRAPFDGRVGVQNVDSGETLTAGQPVVTLIETGTPELRVGLPLNIDASTIETAKVQVGDQLLHATLRQIRPDLDPITRTRTALFTLDAGGTPLIGQTATLLLPTTVTKSGYWVATDALQEGEGSVWTVLVVDDGTARRASVELLHVEETRAYVQGSFEDRAALIRTGAHRVVPGQAVSILTAQD